MTAAGSSFGFSHAERPRVLLVDDDEVNLMLVSAALTQHGFDITEAKDGESALRLLRDWTPDLVVLDARMPGLDGFETCRELRRMYGFENIPVLMLTGLDDEGSINKAYQAGATDFFVKSNQWSLLAGRLRYLLRSARTSLELAKSRSKLARAQDLARMGSFDWRASHGLLMSPEAMRVIGQRPQARFGLRNLLRLVDPVQREAALSLLRQVVKYSTVLDTDVSVVLADGRQRVLHLEAEPEFNEAGHVAGYSGIVQDVTDRRLIEDKIKHLANFDSLTGLPNRRQLIWRAERALDQARRQGHSCALLLIDLDRFKVINDTLGHGVGDELLVECGRRLRSCVRHSDQLAELAELAVDTTMLRSPRQLEAVGRLGGDEFVALLPELEGERDAEQVAQRMLEAMREPVVLGGNEYFVTASVGVAVFPRDGTTVVDLLRNADVAMYSVKGAGRNGMQAYQPHLAGKGRERLALESALHKAVERGELVLHYQPKIDLRSNRIVGAEALMRWQRNGELVAPSEFIPLAEETGLILPMSDWALREAARQVRQWRDEAGLDLSLAVNLPSRVFERADLVQTIRQAAADNGIPHRTLELEITETGLMKDLQVVIPALLQLNQLGVEISIDDFGTGYSSLAYLTSLPISEVKIDRSFVRELGVTEQSSAVVTAVIALARSLGLRVIAEGVETQRQMLVLSRLGCHLMQGYFFTRPLAGPDMARWVRTVQQAERAPWATPQDPVWGTPQALTPRIAHTR